MLREVTCKWISRAGSGWLRNEWTGKGKLITTWTGKLTGLLTKTNVNAAWIKVVAR